MRREDRQTNMEVTDTEASLINYLRNLKFGEPYDIVEIKIAVNQTNKVWTLRAQRTTKEHIIHDNN